MKLIGPFCQIVTMRKLPLRGPLKDEQLEIIGRGGILIEGDTIVDVAEYDILERNYKDEILSSEAPSCENVAFPGFIDAHTHLCWAGSREKDFASRLAGKSYLEIAKAGGGIWDTVQKTRAASRQQLVELMKERINRHFFEGVTTCEIKSGYGLNVDSELKILEAIADLRETINADLVPTCLAAHLPPHDFEGSSADYLKDIVHNLFPLIKKRNLSNRIDIFIEDTAFSEDEAHYYLSEARKNGFDIVVHGDQFTRGGSGIATGYLAKSVDHMEASSDEEILNIANSETVGVALPGASIGLGMPFAPCRRLLNAGGVLAIASDWNPGSAPMGDLITLASILATFEKLSTAEVFAGITYRAAEALNLSDRGILANGKLADIISFPCNDYREILYNQGKIKPSHVWKYGIKHIYDVQKI